mmetsp:Transcript_27714/g.33632  ORF Transcript_27714/g.33632 Transcript_27714/m.33632 type:complete len:89 (-) Transcript_27714:1338-1604(-)
MVHRDPRAKAIVILFICCSDIDTYTYDLASSSTMQLVCIVNLNSIASTDHQFTQVDWFEPADSRRSVCLHFTRRCPNSHAPGDEPEKM